MKFDDSWQKITLREYNGFRFKNTIKPGLKFLFKNGAEMTVTGKDDGDELRGCDDEVQTIT